MGIFMTNLQIALTPTLSRRETTARMQSVENVGNKFSREKKFSRFPVTGSATKFRTSRNFQILILSGLLATALPLPAADADGARLVQERRCYPCHNQSENLLGPPYTAIAERHAKNKDAMVEVLAEKIIVGGAGNWGVVPMVPNEQVSREEARVIAQWILDQEK